MPTDRIELPQLGDRAFLTDSGLETDLLFNRGLELPDFASFVLLDDEVGRSELTTYFTNHAALAAEHGVGIVVETPTWRANRDWAARLGYDDAALAEKNRQAVSLLVAVRDARPADAPPMVISGCIGPRGDGYNPSSMMSVDDAQSYHSTQIETFTSTAADLVSALTMTYADEASGISRAAAAAKIPVVISFTVETDGRLPDGTSVCEAIRIVDEASDSYPAYYMINCAHPTHFDASIKDATATGRLRGIRANASRMSHEELDNSEELDAGDPVELGAQFRVLREQAPDITIMGGCCGTDLRHIESIAQACV